MCFGCSFFLNILFCLQDDKDDLHTLSKQYKFCSVQHIKEMQCQVIGLNQTHQEAGQVGIICNINNGLQCNDDLQAPQRKSLSVKILLSQIFLLNILFLLTYLYCEGYI